MVMADYSQFVEVYPSMVSKYGTIHKELAYAQWHQAQVNKVRKYIRAHKVRMPVYMDRAPQSTHAYGIIMHEMFDKDEKDADVLQFYNRIEYKELVEHLNEIIDEDAACEGARYEVQHTLYIVDEKVEENAQRLLARNSPTDAAFTKTREEAIRYCKTQNQVFERMARDVDDMQFVALDCCASKFMRAEILEWTRMILDRVETPTAHDNKVRVEPLTSFTQEPTSHYDDDAGLDLFLPMTPTGLQMFEPGFTRIDSGVQISIDAGYYGQIKSRSSVLAAGLLCDGVIDSGYDGHIFFQVINYTNKAIEFDTLRALCQLIVIPHVPLAQVAYDFSDVDIESGTENEPPAKRRGARGANSFGSTNYCPKCDECGTIKE